MNHIRGRLTSDVSNFQDIITEIKKGEIKIPKFQRPFVWQAEQAVSLIDSISNGYPVGSLLVWRTSEKLRSERQLGEFSLPDTDEMTPTKYVLDGQQRITVIYSALGAAPEDDGFSPLYDLRSGKITSSSSSASRSIWQFPLRYTYLTSKLLDFRTAIQSLEDGAALQAKLDEFIGSITSYRVPIVELRDLTVEEVCPIFERINSSGTKLSTFDLIAAATWTTEFDLSDEAEEISVSLAPKHFDGLAKETILKCLAAYLTDSVKKEDIMSMRALDTNIIKAGSEKIKESLKITVDQLYAEFLTKSMSFLPYEAHLICLSAIFCDQNSLSAEQLKRMRQWFWRSSFSQHYRGASETFISQSVKLVKEFVCGGEGDPSQFGSIPEAQSILRTKFHFRSAMAKAFVIALTKNGPRNLTNGNNIDIEETLSSYNNKQYHHIFPQAYLKRIGQKNWVDSYANICILSASENNRISDNDPNEYILEYGSKLGESHDEVLAANLMPQLSDVDYKTVEFQEFLKSRSDRIVAHIQMLCAGHV